MFFIDNHIIVVTLHTTVKEYVHVTILTEQLALQS